MPKPTAAESPFGRKDVPPIAVAGLLTFFSQGATGSCYMEAGKNTPLSPCQLIIPQDIALRFSGFTPGADLDVQVTRSDGSVERRRLRVDRDRLASMDWLGLPGDPPGTYQLVGVEGTRRASGTMRVELARQRRMMVAPDTAAPGATIQVALGGFEPGSTIPLHLYREIVPVWGTVTYLTKLGDTIASTRGEALFQLPTRVHDPEGTYAVETEPRSGTVFTSLFKLTIRPKDEAPDAQRDATADLNAAMIAVIEEANRVWASVVAKNGPPVSVLEQVYAEPLLSDVQREISDMRKLGQYHDARKISINIQSVRELPNPHPHAFVAYEVTATEEWKDRLFNADGSLLRTLPSPETWRYRVELMNSWVITEATKVK